MIVIQILLPVKLLVAIRSFGNEMSRVTLSSVVRKNGGFLTAVVLWTCWWTSPPYEYFDTNKSFKVRTAQMDSVVWTSWLVASSFCLVEREEYVLLSGLRVCLFLGVYDVVVYDSRNEPGAKVIPYLLMVLRINVHWFFYSPVVL